MLLPNDNLTNLTPHLVQNFDKLMFICDLEKYNGFSNR